MGDFSAGSRERETERGKGEPYKAYKTYKERRDEPYKKYI
jgi:hypothetical protein